LFTDEVRERFIAATYRLTAQRDRMGARLDSDAGDLSAGGGLTGISDAVVAGDIQISGEGGATVLLADRQPTGGYPRIASVITADLGAVAQLPVQRDFNFRVVTSGEAIAALAQYRSTVEALAGQRKTVVRDLQRLDDLLSYNLVDGVVNATEPR